MTAITIAAAPATMTSREIAELTGKEHKHVLRDIRVMLTELSLPEQGYAQNWTDPQNGQSYPLLSLPKDLTITLVSGYSVAMRHRIVTRWQQLEAEAADPMRALADPIALRQVLLGYTEKVIELEAKIEADAPKVGVYERLVEASGSLNLTQAAKALNLRTRDQLVQKLVQAGWIYRKHGSHGDWLGYQDKCQQGLMVHKLSPYVDANTGETKMSEQVRFTAKGMERMARIFNAVKVLA